MAAKLKNRIIFIGDLALDWYSGVHWANTFESLGFDVERIPEHLAHRERIIQAAKKPFDFFLVSKHFKNVWEMAELRKLGPVILWTLDLYWGLRRESELKNNEIWKADIVISPDGGHDKEFKELGINHFWVKPGVYAKEVKLYDMPKTHEIIFVGTYQGYLREWPYRQRLIEWLRINYGNKLELLPVGEPVRGDELNKLYSSTKVVIGDSVYSPKYWSDRIYETVGRGGFIIHPRVDGLDLEDGKHFVGYNYGDFNALKKKIDFYLENDKEREKIRKQGFNFVKKNCTYKQRCQEVLNVYDSYLNSHN